jgi:hypothetical protein
MKTVKVIETVEELLKFVNSHRAEGDKDPFIKDAKLIFSVNMDKSVQLFVTSMKTLNLKDNVNYILSDSISGWDILRVLGKRSNLEIEIKGKIEIKDK